MHLHLLLLLLLLLLLSLKREKKRNKWLLIINICLQFLLLVLTQAEFTAMRDQYMRRGEGFIICYSITDRRSFQEAAEFKKLIERVRNTEDIPIVLVGNKYDLEHMRVVSAQTLWPKFTNVVQVNLVCGQSEGRIQDFFFFWGGGGSIILSWQAIKWAFSSRCNKLTSKRQIRKVLTSGRNKLTRGKKSLLFVGGGGGGGMGTNMS